ncbi:hypothetical protein H8959_010401 [Pygathrix nigripes]
MLPQDTNALMESTKHCGTWSEEEGDHKVFLTGANKVAHEVGSSESGVDEEQKHGESGPRTEPKSPPDATAFSSFASRLLSTNEPEAPLIDVRKEQEIYLELKRKMDLEELYNHRSARGRWHKDLGPASLRRMHVDAECLKDCGDEHE